MMRRPLSVRGLSQKLNATSRKTGVEYSRLQKLVAICIVERMLPDGTLMKGGNSLSLRFPLSQTRFSEDLDLMLLTSHDEWERQFATNLEKGYEGFTGYLSIRGVAEHGRKNHGLPGFVMWPRDVHLLYEGKSFAKLPLDITPSMDDLTPVVAPISQDIQGLMAYLGFDIPGTARFVSPIEQMIDKSATIYYSDPPRSHDLKDLLLLYPSLRDGGTLPDAVVKGIIADVRDRQGVLVLSDEQIQKIADHYAAQGYGPAGEAKQVAHAIDVSVLGYLSRHISAEQKSATLPAGSPQNVINDEGNGR